jgi:hypothetical protein
MNDLYKTKTGKTMNIQQKSLTDWKLEQSYEFQLNWLFQEKKN